MVEEVKWELGLAFTMPTIGTQLSRVVARTRKAIYIVNNRVLPCPDKQHPHQTGHYFMGTIQLITT